MKKGTLYLVPVALSTHLPSAQTPPGTRELVLRLRHFVAENAKSARVWLRQLDAAFPLQDATIHVLNEHSLPKDLPSLLAPAEAGQDIGLMSEAGCPGVADPGADLVALAHKTGIKVAPLIGPSAIVLALMASGLDGQHFAFHGYLPQRPAEREAKLKELEQRSKRNRETQIFIEAPYRNSAMLESILASCATTTSLCLATDLTAATEFTLTRTIGDWRHHRMEVDRRPTVFLLLAAT